ncbi:serum response factor-like isoform X2 [Micropterus dolomieu]|uniref:serum response factor-like isoform X2 n=1 Tax=Micropterus dolomieu TaxID=147949 RepID=UPI001E8DD5D6|nr:serum response factor-like isoform X2 [Micropterus dolomieu]
MGTRTGVGRAGNGTGISSLNTGAAASESDGVQFDDREYTTEVIYSGSDQDQDQDSDSGDDEDTAGSGGDRRGVKRERRERGVRHQSAASGGLSRGYGGVSPVAPGAKPGKKTRGRVKIKMEFIDNKLRRYTTFSKRKTGIMKKAYELSTLTGTQVLLLVASETGHVYTFATRKLQPMITSETGKALIQTCLNSPDSPPRSDPSSDQRMSATGFEETDLTYQVSEADGCSEAAKDLIKPAFTVSSPPGTTQTSCCSTVQVQTSAPSWQPPSSSNGTVLKTSAGVVLPGGFTLMSGGGVSQQLQTIQVQHSGQQTSTNQSSSDIHIPASSTAGLPACIVSSSSSPSSSSSVTGHMMYPGGHTVMYAAPTSSLADGSLAVLNTFPPTGHAQSHDPASLPQVFLTSLPPVGAQIPVSAVQLHPMLISQQSSSNLTELQVVSLDVHQSKDD